MVRPSGPPVGLFQLKFSQFAVPFLYFFPAAGKPNPPSHPLHLLTWSHATTLHLEKMYYKEKNSISSSTYLFSPYHPHKQDMFMRVHSKYHELLLNYTIKHSSCTLLLLNKLKICSLNRTVTVFIS